MGFQHMHKAVHGAASRKGGKVRKPKGFSSLPPVQRKIVGAMGGTKSNENKRKKVRKNENTESGHSRNLADILGDIDAYNHPRSNP